jgi:hypothetical protein
MDTYNLRKLGENFASFLVIAGAWHSPWAGTYPTSALGEGEERCGPHRREVAGADPVDLQLRWSPAGSAPDSENGTRLKEWRRRGHR